MLKVVEEIWLALQVVDLAGFTSSTAKAIDPHTILTQLFPSNLEVHLSSALS